MYKLFQSSNYEIKYYFYDESIEQNHAFRLYWDFNKCLDYNYNTLMY